MSSRPRPHYRSSSHDPRLAAIGCIVPAEPQIETVWERIRERSKMPFLMTHRGEGANDPYIFLERQRSSIKGVANEGAEQRATRLETLWTHTNSHGVSWDELDEEYIRWAKLGQDRAKRWTDCVGCKKNDLMPTIANDGCKFFGMESGGNMG